MHFPPGKTVSRQHPFSGAILESGLKAIFASNRQFTGYLRITCGDDGMYFLFILKNAVHAAGKYFNRRPEALTIREFFTEVLSRPPEGMKISLHETAPDLFSEFLIFFQVEPTMKAPANLIDLDAFLRRIGEEGADALVVLEDDGSHSFFFISGSLPGTAHFAEAGLDEEGLSAGEHMLLYAYRPGKEVEATIFRTTATVQAPDADDGSHDGILAMLNEALSPPVPTPAEEPSIAPLSVAPKQIEVTVSEGVARGTSRTGGLPFTIGRKEGDLVIADPLISRRHLIIREINGSLVVEDLGSTNGTFVNGVEVKLQQLAPGDVITIGSTEFRVILL